MTCQCMIGQYQYYQILCAVADLGGGGGGRTGAGGADSIPLNSFFCTHYHGGWSAIASQPSLCTNIYSINSF